MTVPETDDLAESGPPVAAAAAEAVLVAVDDVPAREAEKPSAVNERLWLTYGRRSVQLDLAMWDLGIDRRQDYVDI